MASMHYQIPFAHHVVPRIWNRRYSMVILYSRYNEPKSLTNDNPVDQYTFDAFADSWLEDRWFMDDVTDSTAHPYMAINANADIPASNVPPCTGACTVSTEEIPDAHEFNRFRPVALVKQIQWLTKSPRGCIQ
jgi:hypothetical protein